MKPKSTLRNFLMLAGSSLLAMSYSHAATYTWDNSNVTGLTPPSSLNWLNATQGSWTGGTPASGNTNTIQFFQDTTTALLNTGASGNTQASIIDTLGDVAFELGTLTLSGLASSTTGANLTMNISGDALNFSAATGTINLNALNATRTITYNLNSNIQLGTASSAGALTLTGNGTSAFNIGGIISELQTGGGSLIKSGTSTVSLTGANSYTGATNINAGTLTLGGASGAIASTAINLNGGGLTLSNTTNSGARISDSATINVNGNSALTFSHAGVSATDYAETIDTLSLQSGFLTYTGSQAHATGPRTSNVQFNTLSRSGTATVNFAGTGLGVNARNTIKFGAGVTNGVDLGPWAVVNGADFASYSTANGIVAAANTTLLAGSSGNTTNWKLTAGDIAITGGTNPFYKTLLISDTTARTLTTTDNTVSVGGISSIGHNHIISGTGSVQALTAGDALYVNVGSAAANNALSISSVIQNVGGGGTGSAVVKYGAGTLTLSGTNTFTGGLVLNAGTVAVTSASLNNNAITVNGAATLTATTSTTTSGGINLNTGSILSSGNNNTALTVNGVVTGSGTLIAGKNGSGAVTVNLLNSGNDFSGAIFIGAPVIGNINSQILTVNSIGDSSATPITFGYGNTTGTANEQTFAYTGSSALTLSNRYFEFGPINTAAANGSGLIAASGATSAATLTIIKDLVVSGTGGGFTKNLTLKGSNTGNNTFAGKIADGVGTPIRVIKSGTGRWILSATNTYTGATTISGGTLIVNGSISSSSLTTVASAATIGGSGTVGALTVSSGGFISGGDSVDSTSVLNINGAYSQAGLYTAHIDGITTGIFDQLNVTGAVNITGGSLTAMFTGSYAVNDMIFILLNDGVDAITGTYSGLAQGATFSSGGYDWSISYEANNTGIGTGTFTGGNDIVLMAIPEPHTALLGCLGVLLVLRRRR